MEEGWDEGWDGQMYDDLIDDAQQRIDDSDEEDGLPEVYGDEERQDVYPNEQTEESSSEKRDYPEENTFKDDVEKVMENMNIGKIVVKEPGTPEGEDIVEVVKENKEENRGLSWQRKTGKGVRNQE